MKISKIRAFTIIELLIAISVLAVGIVGVLSMFPMGTRIGKSSQLASIAIHLGQAKIEELVSKPYADPSLLPGTTTEPYGSISGFSSFKRVTEINCLNPNFQPVSCGYDPTNDPDPIKKLKVTVFWKSPLGITEKSIYITGLVAKR